MEFIVKFVDGTAMTIADERDIQGIASALAKHGHIVSDDVS